MRTYPGYWAVKVPFLDVEVAFEVQWWQLRTNWRSVDLHLFGASWLFEDDYWFVELALFGFRFSISSYVELNVPAPGEFGDDRFSLAQTSFDLEQGDDQ